MHGHHSVVSGDMGHFYPFGIALLIQFVLVSLFAVGLVIGLNRRTPGRTWLPPLILVAILVPLALADVWLNNGLGNPRIRGVEGMDNDYIAVSLHYDVLIIAAAISLVFVGIALRRRHRAARAADAA